MPSDSTSSKLLSDDGQADCGCPCGRHWAPIEEEVAKRCIKKWSEPCMLITCFRLPDHWYGRHAIHSVYFLCGVLLSVSLIAAVYVWFVMCARCVRIWNFGSAQCRISHVTVNETSYCGCRVADLPDEICVHNFTCVNIVAQYHEDCLGNVTSKLFETAEDLYWAPTSDPHCSFRHSCHQVASRRRHIAAALRLWAFVNSSVPCRYDPLSPGAVFISPGAYTHTVLAFGAANLVVVVVCVVVMLVTFTTCGWRYIWARSAPAVVKREVQQWQDDAAGNNHQICGSTTSGISVSTTTTMMTAAAADGGGGGGSDVMMSSEAWRGGGFAGMEEVEKPEMLLQYGGVGGGVGGGGVVVTT